MESRDVRRTGVDKLPVNLVREEEKVVFLHKVANLIHLAAGVEVAARIVRIADEYTFGALGDKFLDFIDMWQRESLLYRGDNRTDDGSGGNGERHVVSVCRFRNNNLISRIETGEKSKENSFTASCRDDYVIC